MAKIYHKSTGDLIHKFDGTLKECVEDAVKNRVSLACVNLEGSDLSGADLEGADLANANLKGANLCRAYLDDANFDGAELSCANLGECTGLYYAQCSWSGLGFDNSMMTAAVINQRLIFYFECFSGTLEELNVDIQGEAEEFKVSLIKARDFLLSCLQEEE